jgi:hypothetical protein
MIEAMPGNLLLEWLAYCEIDPFGNERQDIQAAMIVSAIANVNRDPKKQKRPYSPNDFMPKFDQNPHPASPAAQGRGRQTPGQMLEIVKMLNAAFGGSEVKHV